MKYLFLTIFLSFYGLTFGQNTYTISGKVQNDKDQKGIEGVEIIIKGADGTVFKTKSDSTGTYQINCLLNSNIDFQVNSFVSSDIGVGKSFTYGKCPNSYTDKYGYINSSSRYKFQTSDTIQNRNFKFDFSLIEICVDMYLPGFVFKKNSTDFYKPSPNEFVTEDTTIDCFVALLMGHATWVIEVSGHSDRLEKDPVELSKLRAEKIRDLLVQKGISKERLFVKYYGKTRILKRSSIFSKKSIAFNARVVFSVLRKDYKE